MPPRFYDTLLGQYLMSVRYQNEGKIDKNNWENVGESTLLANGPTERSIIAPVGEAPKLIYANTNIDLGWEADNHISKSATVNQDQNVLSRIQDPNLKRLLFDTGQAMRFLATGGGPPPNIQDMLFLPFPLTYLEFTNGMLIEDSEPEHADVLRALILNSSREQYASIPITPLGPDGTPTGPATERRVRICQASAFLTSAEEKDGGVGNGFNDPPGTPLYQFVDRTWRFILETGQPITSAGLARLNADPSELPPDMDDATYIVCGDPMGIPERYIGWWERTLISLTELISWCLCYTAAKSIEIISEPLPRNIRRNMERKGIPNPWHVVRVDPKIKPSNGQSNGNSGGPSYRHDVMSHLRFNRHKLKDGSYRPTIELVPAHQRGLANALYVPKISRFDGGKLPAKEMEYFWGKNPGNPPMGRG